MSALFDFYIHECIWDVCVGPRTTAASGAFITNKSRSSSTREHYLWISSIGSGWLFVCFLLYFPVYKIVLIDRVSFLAKHEYHKKKAN